MKKSVIFLSLRDFCVFLWAKLRKFLRWMSCSGSASDWSSTDPKKMGAINWSRLPEARMYMMRELAGLHCIAYNGDLKDPGREAVSNMEQSGAAITEFHTLQRCSGWERQMSLQWINS